MRIVLAVLVLTALLGCSRYANTHNISQSEYKPIHNTNLIPTNVYLVTDSSFQPEFIINNDLPNQTDDTLSAITQTPNPFSPRTTLSFQLKNDDTISVHLYNVKGEELGMLLENEPLKSGIYDIHWYGLLPNNSSVTSGVYFLKISTPAQTVTKKFVLLK